MVAALRAQTGLSRQGGFRPPLARLLAVIFSPPSGAGRFRSRSLACLLPLFDKHSER